MSTSPERALLESLRNHLMADTQVKSILGDPARIYDLHPEAPTFPYVTLGDIATKDASATGAPALEHVVALHLWSRGGGRGQAIDGLNALRSALATAPRESGAHRFVALAVTFADVLRATDGLTFHGVLRVRAISEPLT